MIEIYEKGLHSKVSAFKKWAMKHYPLITEDNDSGEWEIGIKEFEDMCDCAIKLIVNLPCGKSTDQIIDDVLYAIARDNECSRIVQILSGFPNWYSTLCKQSLASTYTNAKWQFAESIKDYTGQDNLFPIIYKFLEVGDEYTERLALMSLACIYPEQAEAYAIEFWNRTKYRNDEYQKIMVLHVLKKIQSSKLFHFLDLAEQSNYKYLKQNAVEIRNKIQI